MNVVQVLLVAGLIYIAMKQKSDKNRNLILVITGLLAFCMMGTEGLAMISGAEISASCTATDATDVAACAAVTLNGTPTVQRTECETTTGCTYTPLSYEPPRAATAAGPGRLTELVNIFSTASNPCSAGKLITDNGTCEDAPQAVVKDMNAFCKENSLYTKYDATGGNGQGTCSLT